MTVFRKADYEVRPIDALWARRFIRMHHYSKGMSNTGTHFHGLFRVGSWDLLGVAAWLPPTRVAAESVNKENWKRVLSLTRLAIHPSVPTNGASFLMAASMRMIESEQKWNSLVTYADTFMGHTGEIYRAANWVYCGETKPIPRWEDETGRQVARKSTRSRTNEEMKKLGLKMVGSFSKHKFVKHLHIRRPPMIAPSGRQLSMFS